MNIKRIRQRYWRLVMNQKRRWLRAVDNNQYDLAEALVQKICKSVSKYRLHLND